jgi:AraC family ethanolamine operon transcriptional activator
MRNHVYRDFDAFASDVREVDCVMMLHNINRAIWSVTHIELPDIRIQTGQLGSGNIVEGQSLSEGYLLYLPLTRGQEYLGNGVSFGMGTPWVLEPGAEFCLSTDGQHDWCTLLLPTKVASAGTACSSSTRSGASTCRIAPHARQAATRIGALVHDLLTAATLCETFETSIAAKQAAAEATSVARVILGMPRTEDPRQDGRPRISRREVIRLCHELLEEQGVAATSVGDLAAGAGVSERTLRTAFHEYFGISPVRFLLLKRMHAIHRFLRAADPHETSVTEVLAAHGEWQFGRFAVRYRRLFGERPSETLAGK